MKDLNNLIEIKYYEGEGYQPLVDFENWRVAILKYIDELLPENIDFMECHNETDEVFILINGRCILFLSDVEDGKIINIHPVNMESGKFYNIKKKVFHTHTLSEDAEVVVVENQNTSSINSQKIFLSRDEVLELENLTKKIWS
ncbi:MAG: hypothetical protein HON98_01540 [Chloroflexi bacterium]|nr:hypothetical protein [Chloroflexota bacterium]MBT4305170.1 hypothetical protein [Chloroflexota bacterium]MBT4754350.1 hypothetical protein [Chloroflexota bacterium]MBT6151376.1 hypothetical protein [Chloroflexota bacterium]MBT6835440.1 hypothetical protein [Bacteroidota bacterium]